VQAQKILKNGENMPQLLALIRLGISLKIVPQRGKHSKGGILRGKIIMLTNVLLIVTNYIDAQRAK
tara:strand:- start:1755 stop:1952 length:198 start_codon:yes stop_codon:yes gene_type:complete